MRIITAIALIGLAIAITLIVVGVTADKQEIAATGAVFLMAWFAIFVAFQVGAEWQRLDTLENYNLTPKVLKP